MKRESLSARHHSTSPSADSWTCSSFRTGTVRPPPSPQSRSRSSPSARTARWAPWNSPQRWPPCSPSKSDWWVWVRHSPSRCGRTGCHQAWTCSRGSCRGCLSSGERSESRSSKSHVDLPTWIQPVFYSFGRALYAIYRQAIDPYYSPTWSDPTLH